MAKKKSSKTVDRTPVVASAIYANAISDEYGNKRDSGLAWLPGEDARCLGIEIPFVLQYLFDLQVFPLGLILQVNGPPQSCKTMFMYECGRFFKDNRGMLEMVLSESKVSHELARSVIGWDDIARKSVFVWYARFMEDIQRILQERIGFAETMATEGFKKHGVPPLGFTFPVLFGVDSIMGANMKEKGEKVQKQGSAGRDFATEALSLTTYLKEISGRVARKPYTILLINHRKETPGATPYEAKTVSIPGGKQLRFQASIELSIALNKSRQSDDIAAASEAIGKRGLQREHRFLTITNDKNSAGTNQRSARIRISWRNRIVDGVSRQVTLWHWDEALVRLITDWQAKKLPGDKAVAKSEAGAASAAGRMKRMDQFFHLRRIDRSKLYWSSTLGMKESDAVPMAEMGRLISRNPDVMAQLRNAFGITGGIVWDTSVDYYKAIRQASKDSLARADTSIDAFIDEINAAYEEARLEESPD